VAAHAWARVIRKLTFSGVISSGSESNGAASGGAAGAAATPASVTATSLRTKIWPGSPVSQWGIARQAMLARAKVCSTAQLAIAIRSALSDMPTSPSPRAPMMESRRGSLHDSVAIGAKEPTQ
jgi:hypothetical protein